MCGLVTFCENIFENRRCLMVRKLSLRVRDQRGFTLIEIIAVLVILAILAVVAVPKYLDLATDAKNKAALGAVAEGKGRLSQFLASYMLNSAGAMPSAATLAAAVNTDAGDFSLTFAASGSDVAITANGVNANVSGGSATGLFKLLQ
jgi:prepilin-type N-terminal cleavage/methylation domain-containing protein